MRSLGRSGRAKGSAALDSALAYTFVAFVYDPVVADVLGHAGCAHPFASATVQESCADVAGYGARADIVGMARGRKCSPWQSSFTVLFVMCLMMWVAPSLSVWIFEVFEVLAPLPTMIDTLLYWLLSAPLPVLFGTVGWMWIFGVLPFTGIEVDRLLFYSLLWVGVSSVTACKGKGQKEKTSIAHGSLIISIPSQAYRVIVNLVLPRFHDMQRVFWRLR